MAEPQQQPEGITGYIPRGILTSFLPWIHSAPSVSGWKHCPPRSIKSLRFSGRRFPRGASRPHTCGRDRRQVRTDPAGHLERGKKSHKPELPEMSQKQSYNCLVLCINGVFIFYRNSAGAISGLFKKPQIFTTNFLKKLELLGHVLSSSSKLKI